MLTTNGLTEFFVLYLVAHHYLSLYYQKQYLEQWVLKLYCSLVSTWTVIYKCLKPKKHKIFINLTVHITLVRLYHVSKAAAIALAHMHPSGKVTYTVYIYLYLDWHGMHINSLCSGQKYPHINFFWASFRCSNLYLWRI